MIPRLRGWSFQLLADGFSMGHPEGPQVAVVHYRERVQPVRRVQRLVRDVLGGWPAFSIDALGPIERATTADGEYAAIVTARGLEGRQPLHRTLGFVVTDDFFSVTTVTCRVEARAAEAERTLRDLVMTDAHALGIRRRRYEYPPPAGFQPVRQSLITEWIPPDYPRNATTICVYPANPLDGPVEPEFVRVALDLAALGYQVTESEPIADLANAHGLTGTAHQVMAARPGEMPAIRLSAELVDRRYVYPLHVSCHSLDRWAEMRDAFLHLVHGIRSIPGANAGRAPPPPLFLFE